MSSIDQIPEALITQWNGKTTIWDSGASKHMSPYRDDFIDYKPLEGNSVRLGNSSKEAIMGRGTLKIKVPNRDTITHMLLKDTLHVPKLHCTLVSLGQLEAKGGKWTGENGKLILQDSNGKIRATIPKVNGLYVTKTNAEAYMAETLYDLHVRLGHINYNYLKKLIPQYESLRITNWDEKECIHCLKGKAKWAPISKERISIPMAEKYEDQINIDIWGPASTSTQKHYKYFLTLIDKATR